MTLKEAVVKVSSVGKRFYITSRSEQTLFKSLRNGVMRNQKELWALRDVSFDVYRGESLGVIGPNGSGKTTLLMILAEIMAPTTGSVEVRGELRTPILSLSSASLAALSVEDNIRFCGALLGLASREMDRRLERIIEFGELEPYRYAEFMELSSGFQARVFFSTALHSDSDIILVDETLAVGDMRFMLKCQKAFERLKADGKTIILVSHDMDKVKSTCDRCVYLSGGRLKGVGPAAEIVQQFVQDHASKPI